jgi:hypothetical protein
MADDMPFGEVKPSKPRPITGTALHDKLVSRRDELERAGFVHVGGSEMSAYLGALDGTRLRETANNLPLDSSGDGQRRRMYRTGFFNAWTDDFRFDPAFQGADGPYVPYWQSAGTNADASGRERRFAPLPDDLENDPLLQQAVRVSFKFIPSDYIACNLPIRVGLHLIRLYSDGRRVCTPSPNHLHTDGEPFTAIILLDRVNIADHTAISFVADRACAGHQPVDVPADSILAKVRMSEALETLMVDDGRVSHSVSGALGATGKPGYRTSLLIDFSDIRLERTPEPTRIF